MAVNVSEVPLPSDLTSSPPSTFKDKNITVYSIPVLEDSHRATLDLNKAPNEQSADAITVTGATKRKRERSPIDESLGALMDEESFSAEKLQGELADEWRRLMVKTMFPASGSQSSPVRKCRDRDKQQNKRQKKTKEPEEPQIPEHLQNVCFLHRICLIWLICVARLTCIADPESLRVITTNSQSLARRGPSALALPRR